VLPVKYGMNAYILLRRNAVLKGYSVINFFPLLKSCVTQNFITIKTSWNTND
jgi:hypothetical protein